MSDHAIDDHFGCPVLGRERKRRRSTMSQTYAFGVTRALHPEADIAKDCVESGTAVGDVVNTPIAARIRDVRCPLRTLSRVTGDQRSEQDICRPVGHLGIWNG